MTHITNLAESELHHEHEITMTVPIEAFNIILDKFHSQWIQYFIVEGKIRIDNNTKLIQRYYNQTIPPMENNITETYIKKLQISIPIIQGILEYKHQIEYMQKSNESGNSRFQNFLIRYECTEPITQYKFELSIRIPIASNYFYESSSPLRLLEILKKEYQKFITHNDNIVYNIAIEAAVLATPEKRHQAVKLILNLLAEYEHTLDHAFYTNVFWWHLTNLRYLPYSSLMKLKVLQLEIPTWNSYAMAELTHPSQSNFWLSHKPDGFLIVGIILAFEQRKALVVISRLSIHFIFSTETSTWIVGLNDLFQSNHLQLLFSLHNIEAIFDGECVPVRNKNDEVISLGGYGTTYILFSGHFKKNNILSIDNFERAQNNVNHVINYIEQYFSHGGLICMSKQWVKLPANPITLHGTQWTHDGYILAISNPKLIYSQVPHFKIKTAMNCTVDVLITPTYQLRIMANKDLVPIPQLFVGGGTLQENFHLLGNFNFAPMYDKSQIYECRFDGDDHRLVPVRLRQDKLYPNTLKAFFSTLIAHLIPEIIDYITMIQPIGDFQRELKQSSLRYSFTHCVHRAIQEHLNYPIRILDLGCGRFSYYKIILDLKPQLYLGTDISRIHIAIAMTRLINMIEPSSSNKKLYKKNNYTLQHIKNIHFMAGSFIDPALKYEINAMSGKKKFNYILCIHAIQFACASAETLKTFVQLCDTALDPINGKVIIICMDGDAIMAHLNALNSTNTYSIAHGYLAWRRSDKNPEEIEAKPPFNNEFRVEPLIYNQQLCNAFAEVNLVLTEKAMLRIPTDVKKTRELQELTRIHVYYVFERKKNNRIHSQIETTVEDKGGHTLAQFKPFV